MTTLDICNMALSSLGHERRVTDLAAQTKEAARLPFIPGVMTPSEVLVAREHGFTLMKLFPAAQAGASGFSWYLVDLNDESIAKSKPIVSLGLHACPAVDISLRDTPCTLIGGPGCGLKYFDAMADGMSLCAAAMSLGVMKGSFQSALDYTADRYQGGRQIIDWPQVRMMLANMAIESKTGDALFSRARQEMENECQRWGFTARAAAVHIGELAVKSTADGIQLFGGNGYMKDYPQEKRFRDARQSQCLLGMAALKKIHYIADYIEENK